MRIKLRPLSFVLVCGALVACGDDASTPSDTDGSTGGTDTTAPSTDTSATSPTSGPGVTTSEETTDGESSTTDPTETESSTGSGSDDETSSADETPPEVAILSPRPGTGVAARQWTFEGTVTDDASGVSTLVYDGPDGEVDIDVNDDGSFSARIVLVPGTQDYTFTAVDGAGNTGSGQTQVHFGHRVSVGNSQAAYLREGSLFTWGRNELGQLGNGTLEGSGYGDDPETADLPVRYAVDVDGLVSVVTRQTFMLGLADDGTVLSWGSNDSGQLGREAEDDCGSSSASPCGRVPTAVPGVTGAVAIDAGFDHALVLREDGTVWAFGSNEYGQLGDAAAGETRMQPEQIEGLTGIIEVAAGSDVSYALTEGGTVVAWGENDRGQLGRGTTDSDAHADPLEIEGVAGAVHVAAANTTAFALLEDGTVLAWGRNSMGQAGIGDGSGDNVLVPAPVVDEDGNALTGVVNVAGDGFVGLALTADGDAYAMGMGALGQLGQGYLEDGERDLENRIFASPVAVDPGDADAFDILELEVGAGGPGLALSTEGNLFGWGWSFQGSLGLEGAINAWAYSAPVLVFAAD